MSSSVHKTHNFMKVGVSGGEKSLPLLGLYHRLGWKSLQKQEAPLDPAERADASPGCFKLGTPHVCVYFCRMLCLSLLNCLEARAEPFAANLALECVQLEGIYLLIRLAEMIKLLFFSTVNLIKWPRKRSARIRSEVMMG